MTVEFTRHMSFKVAINDRAEFQDAALFLVEVILLAFALGVVLWLLGLRRTPPKEQRRREQGTQTTNLFTEKRRRDQGVQTANVITRSVSPSSSIAEGEKEKRSVATQAHATCIRRKATRRHGPPAEDMNGAWAEFAKRVAREEWERAAAAERASVEAAQDEHWLLSAARGHPRCVAAAAKAKAEVEAAEKGVGDFCAAADAKAKAEVDAAEKAVGEFLKTWPKRRPAE